MRQDSSVKSSRVKNITEYENGAGAELYEKAKTLIPGGTQLLSKRPEMFLPGQWPNYYQRAQGCFIWDLDGRRFIDMTTCGIGTCLLGYADADVPPAARRAAELAEAWNTRLVVRPIVPIELHAAAHNSKAEGH